MSAPLYCASGVLPPLVGTVVHQRAPLPSPLPGTESPRTVVQVGRRDCQ